LETESEWKREEIAQYQSESDCENCKGMRLKDEALCVKIDNLNISEVTRKPISEAKKWFKSLNDTLKDREKKILEELDKAAKEGKGAAQLDGRMIDAASARMAENIVNINKLIESK